MRYRLRRRRAWLVVSAAPAAQPSGNWQHLPIGPAGDELPGSFNDSKGLRRRHAVAPVGLFVRGLVAVMNPQTPLAGTELAGADPWLTDREHQLVGVLAVLILALTDGASPPGHWLPPNAPRSRALRSS